MFKQTADEILNAIHEWRKDDSQVTGIDLICEIEGKLLVDRDTFNACEAKECSYYAHYLVHHDPTRDGCGPRMEHEAFHHAEKRCSEAQQAVLQWYGDNEGNNKQIPPHLERKADMWERKVCA